MLDSLPDKINDRAYAINLDEYADIGAHCIALYSMELHLNGNTITYFGTSSQTHSKRNQKVHQGIYNNKKYF